MGSPCSGGTQEQAARWLLARHSAPTPHAPGPHTGPHRPLKQRSSSLHSESSLHSPPLNKVNVSLTLLKHFIIQMNIFMSCYIEKMCPWYFWKRTYRGNSEFFFSIIIIIIEGYTVKVSCIYKDSVRMLCTLYKRAKIDLEIG